MAGKQLTSQGDYITASFGQNGSVKDSGAKTFTGPFCVIKVLEDTAVSTINYQDGQPKNYDTTGAPITSDTWLAGDYIYGNIQSFIIDSGKCEAYKK